MSFVNRIRLPIKITRPQIIEEREIFRKANGQIKVLSVVLRKQYEGETDLLPEKIHERLVIALAHDDVRIEGDRYIGGVVKDGDYAIAWVDFMDYPIAKATFKVFATPYNASNSNCGTCQEMIQVVANDDDYGDANENTVIYVDVLANDEICCEPITLTVITINSTYVQSAGFLIVGFSEQLQIVLKDDLSTQNNVLLATYRVQCANGQFDEANVYANIIGTGEAVCLSPENITVLSTSDTGAEIAWNASAGNIDYEWVLYLATDLINPVDSGTTSDTTLTLTGLTENTEYVIMVRATCADDEFSNYVQTEFTTNPETGSGTCGRYQLVMDDPDGSPDDVEFIAYMDCNGDGQNTTVRNFRNKSVCALQNSEGDPVFLVVGPNTTIHYQGLC